MRTQEQKGSTLVEIAIVVLIIGVIVTATERTRWLPAAK
jgi:prepilin-type N-terminal cleavage/methylation domain-containing protein